MLVLWNRIELAEARSRSLDCLLLENLFGSSCCGYWTFCGLPLLLEGLDGGRDGGRDRVMREGERTEKPGSLDQSSCSIYALIFLREGQWISLLM